MPRPSVFIWHGSAVIGFVTLLPLLASGLPAHTCKADLTSLAALSCRVSPHAPTASCCDALLYALDTMPDSSVDRGVCCLCVYIASKQVDYDIASAYSGCGGKYASQVSAWLASAHTLLDCNDPCHVVVPSPPASPTRTDGSKGKRGEGKKGKTTIILIVVFGVVATLLAGGVCIYFAYFRPAAKDHQSPATTDSDESSPEQADTEMSSLGRRSTSRLL